MKERIKWYILDWYQVLNKMQQPSLKIEEPKQQREWLCIRKRRTKIRSSPHYKPKACPKHPGYTPAKETPMLQTKYALWMLQVSQSASLHKRCIMATLKFQNGHKAMWIIKSFYHKHEDHTKHAQVTLILILCLPWLLYKFHLSHET